MFSDLAQSLLAPLLKKNGHRNNVISDSCLLGDDLAAFYSLELFSRAQKTFIFIFISL